MIAVNEHAVIEQKNGIGRTFEDESKRSFRPSLRRALLISDGDYRVFIDRPISLGLLIAAVLLLIVVILPSFRRVRQDAFVE